MACVGSPQPGGRTAAVARAVLAGAAERTDGEITVEPEFVELGSGPALQSVLRAMQESDAIVFASPTYRARCTSQLKQLLENTERGFYGEGTAPLQGKAALIVQTGASDHHFLAIDDLRSVLAGFFAVQVLSPGLYFGADAFTADGGLSESASQLAKQHGRALVDLAVAVRGSAAISALRPMV